MRITGLESKLLSKTFTTELAQVLNEQGELIEDTRILPRTERKWDITLLVDHKNKIQPAKLEVLVDDGKQEHILWDMPVELR